MCAHPRQAHREWDGSHAPGVLLLGCHPHPCQSAPHGRAPIASGCVKARTLILADMALIMVVLHYYPDNPHREGLAGSTDNGLHGIHIAP